MSSGGLNTNRLILVEDMVRENGCPCLFQTAFSADGEGDTVHPQVTTGAICKIEKITSLQTAKMRILHDDSVRDRRYSRNSVERSSFEGCEINIPVGCPLRVIRSDKKKYSSISQIMEDMPPYIRVEEDIMGITTADDKVNMFRVPKNTVLKLHKNQTENKCLLCLMNETKEVMFHSNCTGEFTGLDDNAEYALADLLEKVQLPVQVDLHTVNQDDIANEDERSTENLRTMLSGPVEIVSVARTQLYVGCIWICDGTYQPFVLPIKSGMYCYPLARTQSKEALVSRYFSSKIDFESFERKIYNINVDPPSILFLKKIAVAWRNVPRYSTTGSLDEKDRTPSRKEETDNDYKDVSPVFPYRRALRRSLSGEINVNCADSMSNEAPQLPPRRNRSRDCRPLTSYTPSSDYFRNEVHTNCGKGMGEQQTKALVQHDIMVKNMSSVIKDFPPCIRVEEELTVIKDNGQGCIVLPRGLQLILIKVDSSSEEMGKNAILVCRCDSTVLSLPSICQGHFTASMDDTDYTLQEIVEKISVPKTVTFNKLKLKDFISTSELANDRLFNALSGPVEILAVENIESYIGCEHQKSVNILYNIVVLPTFLNLSVHLSKDVVNTNKLLEEYFLKPTFKLVTFIESNLFSFGCISRVPIYLQFPGSEKSSVKDDLTDNEKEMNLSCPLYDSPSASTLPDKPLCSKDTGPHPTMIITRKEGVRRRIVQVEESLQRLLVNESVLAKTMDNKERVGYEGQRSVDPGAGKQLELYPGYPRHVLQNADKPQSMSGYALLFRDVDNYDMAAEDSNVYEPVNINDDEYEYVSVQHETSSLTSPNEAKQDETDLPVTGSGYGRYAMLPRENSVRLTPAYENVDTNKIAVNKETVASGDPQKHGTLDLSYSSQKAALYENVTSALKNLQ